MIVNPHILATIIAFAACVQQMANANTQHVTTMQNASHHIREIHDKDKARFWAKVEKKEGDECWIWCGVVSRGGYGSFKIRGKFISAHRFSWMLHNGDIPISGGHHGICVLHTCDVRSCVRPDHLWLGTHDDNMRDKVLKGRCNVAIGDAHGTRTHPEKIRRGENVINSRLTESAVIEMRRRVLMGDSRKEIALEFGVSVATAVQAINGTTWKHLPGAIYTNPHTPEIVP